MIEYDGIIWYHTYILYIITCMLHVRACNVDSYLRSFIQMYIIPFFVLQTWFSASCIGGHSVAIVSTLGLRHPALVCSSPRWTDVSQHWSSFADCRLNICIMFCQENKKCGNTLKLVGII